MRACSRHYLKLLLAAVGETVIRTERDAPMPWIGAALMLAADFCFSAVAAYMASVRRSAL